jgi:glucose-6-phosphate 1-epimerase
MDVGLFVLQLFGTLGTRRPKHAMPDFGDEEYKSMLYVGAAAIEKPITLKPGEEWIGKQEISTVPSSYSSGQLDPELIRRMHTI